jgi:hypothetical protein
VLRFPPEQSKIIGALVGATQQQRELGICH